MTGVEGTFEYKIEPPQTYELGDGRTVAVVVAIAFHPTDSGWLPHLGAAWDAITGEDVTAQLLDAYRCSLECYCANVGGWWLGTQRMKAAMPLGWQKPA